MVGNCAFICNEDNFTVFKYGNYTIRFEAPYSLEKYTDVIEWNDGYLVVMAKYKHNKDSEEEYIDLVPKVFLRQIKKVVIDYDGC